MINPTSLFLTRLTRYPVAGALLTVLHSRLGYGGSILFVAEEATLPWSKAIRGLPNCKVVGVLRAQAMPCVPEKRSDTGK